MDDGSFTVESDDCDAFISISAGHGTEIKNAKIGCMLNSGSVALPFSEYTDVAVVKDN